VLKGKGRKKSRSISGTEKGERKRDLGSNAGLSDYVQRGMGGRGEGQKRPSTRGAN